MLELIEKYKDRFADPSNEVDFVLNMAPHQSNKLTAPDGVSEYSIDHKWDLLSGNDMGNLKAAFTSNEGVFSAHQNGSFSKDIGKFLSAYKSSNGNSKKLVNQFINGMRDKYGIEVTVK